jgi:hypothetical protein
MGIRGKKQYLEKGILGDERSGSELEGTHAYTSGSYDEEDDSVRQSQSPPDTFTGLDHMQ